MAGASLQDNLHRMESGERHDSGPETDTEASSEGTSAPVSPTGRTALTLQDAMLSVEQRFVLNLPEEELSSVDRLFFQLEQAYWFYEDFLADAHPTLPHYPSFESFTQALFQHSGLLRHLQEQHSDLLGEFHSYKYAVPVYGCALLSPGLDKIVLVCTYEGKCWSLPRGKVNQGEEPIDCAARETLEECGYDVTGKIREEDSFTVLHNSKLVKMYIIRDVPEDFPFQPQVRKEVGEVRFFALDSLPPVPTNISRCVAHVRHWITKLQKQQSQRRDSTRKLKKAGSDGDNVQEARGDQSPLASARRSGSNTRGQGRARSAPAVRLGGKDQKDVYNVETFGEEQGQEKGWSVEAMFKANEVLTGRKYEYDGNPHTFADQTKGEGRSLSVVKQSKRMKATEARRKDGGGHKSDKATFAGGVNSTQQQQMTPAQLSLAPAVAALLGQAMATQHMMQKQEPQQTAIHSCASLERIMAGAAKGGKGLVDVEGDGMGLDSLASTFQFDTQDILGNLGF